jgi:hypothetical protein
MADERQPREDRRHEPPVLPLPARTQFERRGIARRGLEAGITQDHHRLLTRPTQPLTRVSGDIGRGTGPPHEHPPGIEPPTAFAADQPAMIGKALAANWLGPAACTPGRAQLDPRGVNDAEHGRGGQERPRPSLMGLEETQEPGALGKPRKSRPIVARQPAIKGPGAPAFELPVGHIFCFRGI